MRPATKAAMSVPGLSRLAFLVFIVWVSAVIFWGNLQLNRLQAESPGLPFGVIKGSEGHYYLQDFSFHMLFFKGVRDRIVPSPYRFQDQEILMRHLVPALPAAMGHAYSPVAFVLMSPLLSLSGQQLYLFYTLLAGVATLTMLYFYILPRVQTRLQLFTIVACTVGVCLSAAFVTGQSTLITTPLLAAFWFVLQRPGPLASWVTDAALALLFWALCLKPSIAIVPFFLLLGARRWRALTLSTALLLITWTATAGYYGGWWSGLCDYAALLAGYHPGDFPAYMRRDAESPLVNFLHPYDVALFVILNFALLFARWLDRITPSEHFQGSVWNFLLFSPYLLGSEYWILVLLVVEGRFFLQTSPVLAALKILLIAGILDFRLNVNTPVDFSLPCKWILFVWIMGDLLLHRRRENPPARTAETSIAAA